MSGLKKKVTFKNKREKAYGGHPAEQWSEAKRHVQEFLFAILKVCFENNFKLFHLIIGGMKATLVGFAIKLYWHFFALTFFLNSTYGILGLKYKHAFSYVSCFKIQQKIVIMKVYSFQHYLFSDVLFNSRKSVNNK